MAASQDILEFVLFEFVSGYEEHEDENMITGTMQHVPRVTKVRQVNISPSAPLEIRYWKCILGIGVCLRLQQIPHEGS